MDIEGEMYEQAKSLGIALITITHRSSLWKFHTHMLQFDGEGGWRLEPLDANSRLSLKEQKDKLEQELSEFPEKQSKLKQLCTLLGEDSHLIVAIDNPPPLIDTSSLPDDDYPSLEYQDASTTVITASLDPKPKSTMVPIGTATNANGHVKFCDNA